MSLTSGIVSYSQSAAHPAFINVRLIDFGSPVYGIDSFLANDADYFSFVGQIVTGELKLDDVGRKFDLHEINVKMFCTPGTADADLPDVIVMAKDSDDAEWNFTGYGAIDGTFAFPSSSSSTVFSTGVHLARLCRFYIGTTKLVLGTDYEITNDREITLTTPLTAGDPLYCYCESAPYVNISVGDYLWTGEKEFTRIASFVSGSAMMLEWNPSDQTTPRHVRAVTCPCSGESLVKYPLTGIYDVLQLRIIVIPKHSSTAPKEVKVIGAEAVFVDAGMRQFKKAGGS